MKLSIESKVGTGFILSILIVLMFSLSTFSGMRSLISENNRHRQAQEILKSAKKVQFSLIHAVGYSREYILSGSEESYLSYKESIRNAEEELDRINSTLKEKEFELPKKEFIRYFLMLKSVNEQIIETRRRHGATRAMSMMLEGKVAEAGNKIVYALRKIEEAQRNDLFNGFQNDIDMANRSIVSFSLLVIAVMIVLSVVYYLFKKDLTHRKEINAELDQMNETLEMKIKARTEALIHSVKKYRFLADNVMDVISLHAFDGTYTYVSESCKQMGGYEPSDILGKTAADFVHPEDLGLIQNVHRNLLSTGISSGAINFRFRKKSGEYFWAESIGNIVRDENGNFENIIVCTRDVSERIKAESALKEHQQMLQGILDNTKSMIFIRNLNDEYLLVNKQFEKMRKRVDSTAEEVNSLYRMDEILPAEMLHRERQREQEIIAENICVEFEVKIPVSDAYRDYSFTKFPLYNEKGEVYAICGIGTDITSHKLAQKEISDSKAQLRALILNSSDSIWSVNKDMKLTDFNTTCSNMMNKFYGSSLYPQMDVKRMTDSGSVCEWEECYQTALRGEYFSREMKLMEGPENHYYDVSFNPVVVNDQVEGVAVFARDITSRKKMERELSYKVNELNTFMYKATHDLRSPLVSLMGLVELAQGETGADAPELTNYFDMIGKSVTKMDNLLVDLVSITSVSQGKLMVNRVDFRKTIADITDSLRHYPNFGSITIRNRISDEVPFYNDDKLLYSVLQNLIDNAIKYSRSGNSANALISVIVECSVKSVVINIVDNGIGISERSQEKVFDMFYRASNVSSGTGLGLYIVKTAVEKMKGKISLVSKESEGTSIYITLPNFGEESFQMSA